MTVMRPHNWFDLLVNTFPGGMITPSEPDPEHNYLRCVEWHIGDWNVTCSDAPEKGYSALYCHALDLYTDTCDDFYATSLADAVVWLKDYLS